MSVSASQPIADWLAKIGLERYASAFADTHIDVSVLRHSTECGAFLSVAVRVGGSGRRA